MNSEIFFSNDSNIKMADIKSALALADSDFNTSENRDFIACSEDVSVWILNNIPECWCIIKDSDKVIGQTFLLPTSSELMEKFLQGSLSESELFEEAIKDPEVSYQSICFSGSNVLADYRRQGLATRGFLKSLQFILSEKNPTPELYYWPTSNEGSAIGKKGEQLLAEMGLVLKCRE